MTRPLILACVLSTTVTARAESVRYYEMEGFGHFLDGNPETTAVGEDGAITLPPEVKERFADNGVTFGTATALGDEVVVSRVDDGQVLGIDAAGKKRNIYKADEAMITSMLGIDSTLYVAVGSPARLYKIGKDGKAASFYSPEANFIWDLAAGPDDSVFIVTGEPGTVVHVSKKGEGKVIFKSDQAHLRAATYDKKLGLFVGGGERGVVYRSTDNKTFHALYDTGNPEVTAIAVREPYVYVSGVTGAASLVNEESGKKGKAADVHSQLMRVTMDGAAEVLAGSSDEAIFSLALDERNQVLVSTGATGRDDPRGRLYSIDPDKKLISMIYQSPSRRITHLVPLSKGHVAAVAAQSARITQLSNKVARSGEFLTLPFDMGINSKFGILQLLGSFPKGTSAEAQLRSGQTSDPDESWSAWSKAVDAPGNKAVQLENGRYMQVRVTLKSDGETSPAVQRVRVAYLRQNLPPFVREVSTLHKGFALVPIPQDEVKAKTVAIGEKSESGADNAEHHAPVRARQVPEHGALTIKWVSDDPNGDDLKFELFVRAVNDHNWRLLKGDLDQPFYVMKSSQLPDGHYIFKVRASDAPSNPDGLDRHDQRESRAILVDNTPPKFGALKVSTSGKKATVKGNVEDAVGPLMELSYALDSGEPRPILPDDGVLDGPSESFSLELDKLEPGHHTLTVRAVDEADNEGFAEAVFDL